MAAASAASKLLRIGKNRSLRSLIHRNLLRGPAVSTTGAPVSQTLNSALDSQIPVVFSGEVPNLKTNAFTAAEVLKMVYPDLGVSYEMMSLPGIDQSGRILKNHNNRKDPVEEDDDEFVTEVDDDFVSEEVEYRHSEDFSESSDSFSDSDYDSYSDPDYRKWP